MTKIYVVGGAYGYGRLFQKHGWEVVIDLEEADIACFTGGEDVSPNYYGEQKHIRTYNNPVRDSVEKSIFNILMEKEIPMVGICRGGQFLNCMSGGKMYQHVSNHTCDHDMMDVRTGQILFVSSTHHQMMRPGPGAELVATAQNDGYKESMDGNAVVREYFNNDVEVVYYPLTNALCFQPHPEFDGPEYEDMKKYFFECISTYLKIN